MRQTLNKSTIIKSITISFSRNSKFIFLVYVSQSKKNDVFYIHMHSLLKNQLQYLSQEIPNFFSMYSLKTKIFLLFSSFTHTYYAHTTKNWSYSSVFKPRLQLQKLLVQVQKGYLSCFFPSASQHCPTNVTIGIVLIPLVKPMEALTRLVESQSSIV